MNLDLYDKFEASRLYVNYLESRACGLIFRDPAFDRSAPPPRPLTVKALREGELSLIADADGRSDPASSPLDGPGLREAKALYRQILRRPEDGEPLMPVQGLPQTAAGILAGNLEAESDETLELLLLSVLGLGNAYTLLDLRPVFAGLSRFPERPALLELLSTALALAASWNLTFLFYGREDDPYLARIFRIAEACPPPGPFRRGALLFKSLAMRAGRPDPVRYGPGAGRDAGRRRAAGLINALYASAFLEPPQAAALLFSDIIRHPDHLGLTLEDLQAAASPFGPFGFPDNPWLKACWGCLEASLASRRRGRRAETSEAVMTIFLRLGDKGLLGRLSDRDLAPAEILEDASMALGNALAALDPEDMEEAVAFLASCRSDGNLRPDTYDWIVRRLLESKRELYREAVLSAASSGLFGAGSAVLHAVAGAVCFPGARGTRASADCRACARSLMEIEPPDWTVSPLGLRLAGLLAQADILVRDGRSPHRPLRALLKLWPSYRGAPDPEGFAFALPEGDDDPEFDAEGYPGPEAYGDPLDPDSPKAADSPEARDLCLFAYAGALIIAERSPAHSAGIPARLFPALPKEVTDEPRFAETLLPDAVYAAMGGERNLPPEESLAGALQDSGLPLLEHAEIMGITAINLALELAKITPRNAKTLLPLLERAELILGHLLPPWIRSALVGACVIAYGHLGLCDEMEEFYSRNCLMHVFAPQVYKEPLEPGYRDFYGIPGDPSLSSSARVRFPQGMKAGIVGYRPLDWEQDHGSPAADRNVAGAREAEKPLPGAAGTADIAEPKEAAGPAEAIGPEEAAGPDDEEDLEGIENGEDEEGEDAEGEGYGNDENGGKAALDSAGAEAAALKPAPDGGPDLQPAAGQSGGTGRLNLIGLADGNGASARGEGGSDVPAPLDGGTEAIPPYIIQEEKTPLHATPYWRAMAAMTHLTDSKPQEPEGEGEPPENHGAAWEEPPLLPQPQPSMFLLIEDAVCESDRRPAVEVNGYVEKTARLRHGPDPAAPEQEPGLPGGPAGGPSLPAGAAPAGGGPDGPQEPEDDDGGRLGKLYPKVVTSMNPQPWAAMALYNAQWGRHRKALELLLQDRYMTSLSGLKTSVLLRLLVILAKEGKRPECSVGLNVAAKYAQASGDGSILERAKRLVALAEKRAARKPKNKPTPKPKTKLKPKTPKPQKKGGKKSGPKKGGGGGRRG
ncbi:MAG: hypothetical protein LBW85_04725 [Deltaproteobacteria bacterium]|jgi:hypothetical protein|nr:hypothetical protein [Deltaproteobacteria bacterium]